MRLVYLLLSLTMLLGQPALFAQIGISGSPHPSAVLDLKSPANDKAFYPPRLTSTQRLAIPNPQVGAFVYDLDKGTMYLYDGQNWLPLLTTDPSLLPPVARNADDGAANDYLGNSVAISGDYAIVGAPNKTVGGNSTQGAAYVFMRSGTGWTQQQRLTADDGAISDYFGGSVAIAEDYAIVGADVKTIGSNSRQGAAYVFVRSGSSWSQQQRLTLGNGVANDEFGFSVAITGDYAIVGAAGKAIGNNNGQGAVYVFVRSGSSWSQQQLLTASDGAANDSFGNSMAIAGDYAIVGAPYKTIGSNSRQGAAYVFVRSGISWTQQQRITPSDGAANDSFGLSVAIAGGYAIAGAPYKIIGSNSKQGTAYIFVRSGTDWSQQQRLTASDGAANDEFGRSVAIAGNYAIVGAYGKAIGSNSYQGAAYLFMRGNSWTQQQRVTDNSPPYTQNGLSVGLFNGTFIIGGPGFQNYRGKVSFGTVN